jgi:hypothetical protein
MPFPTVSQFAKQQQQNVDDERPNLRHDACRTSLLTNENDKIPPVSSVSIALPSKKTSSLGEVTDQLVL